MDIANTSTIKDRQALTGLPASAWLTTAEAAAVLGLAASTLHTWRCKGDERLRYHRAGRIVRYLRSDLDAFMSGSTRGGRAA